MFNKLACLFMVAAATALISCSKPESEPAPEAAPAPEVAPAEAPVVDSGDVDPTVVDPGHYTAEFDNDRVRIVRIAYGAGEASVMHYHPDSVAVFLTDQLVQMTMPDGSTEEISASAGDSIFLPAGQHLPKNISDADFELVLVELKSGTSAATDAGGPDPIVVDADHYTAELDNDRARILRIAYGAGESSVMHYHPDSVAVFLNDQRVQMTMPDGSTEEISSDGGGANYLPAGSHLPKNVSDADLELVLIELK